MCAPADDIHQEDQASMLNCSPNQSKVVEETQDTHGSGDDSTGHGQDKAPGKNNNSKDVQTKHVEEFDHSLENNDGNVAFVIKSYTLSKKPTSDRKCTTGAVRRASVERPHCILAPDTLHVIIVNKNHQRKEAVQPVKFN